MLDVFAMVSIVPEYYFGHALLEGRDVVVPANSRRAFLGWGGVAVARVYVWRTRGRLHTGIAFRSHRRLYQVIREAALPGPVQVRRSVGCAPQKRVRKSVQTACRWTRTSLSIVLTISTLEDEIHRGISLILCRQFSGCSVLRHASENKKPATVQD